MTEGTAKAQRLNISFSNEALNDIKKLADQYGMSMSEFVRNSVRVYGALKKETQDHPGNKILIGNKDEIQKELLVP